MTAASNAFPPLRPAADTAVVRSIREASRATKVDFGLLMAEAAQESGFRPDAKAAGSSAAGLFQFVDSTWLDMVRRYGDRHGIGALAQEVNLDASGRPAVADPEARRRILDLRNDPRLAAALAGEYTRQNQQDVERALGRPVSRGELYVAHFLGAGGAASLLKAVAQDGDRPAAALLPEAAAANRSVFYDAATGQPRSVGEIYRNLTGKIEGEARDFGQDFAALGAGDATAGSTAPAMAHRLGLAGTPVSPQLVAMLDVVALAALRLAGRTGEPTPHPRPPL